MIGLDWIGLGGTPCLSYFFCSERGKPVKWPMPFIYSNRLNTCRHCSVPLFVLHDTVLYYYGVCFAKRRVFSVVVIVIVIVIIGSLSRRKFWLVSAFLEHQKKRGASPVERLSLEPPPPPPPLPPAYTSPIQNPFVPLCSRAHASACAVFSTCVTYQYPLWPSVSLSLPPLWFCFVLDRFVSRFCGVVSCRVVSQGSRAKRV